MCTLDQGKTFIVSDDGTGKVLGPSFETIREMKGSKTYMLAIATFENNVVIGNDSGAMYYYDLDSTSEPKVSLCTCTVFRQFYVHLAAGEQFQLSNRCL